MYFKNMVIQFFYSLLLYFLNFLYFILFVLVLILVLSFIFKFLFKIINDNNIIRVILNSIRELYANLFVIFFLKYDINSLLNNQNAVFQKIINNNGFKKKKINFSKIKFNFKKDELIFNFIPSDFVSIKFFEDEKNLKVLEIWINQRYYDFEFSSFFKENNNFILIGRKKI